MADKESIVRTLPVTNRLEKYGPGKTPGIDAPDEVIDWAGEEEVPEAAGRALGKVRRIARRMVNLGLAVTIGLASAIGWAAGLDRAHEPMMAGGLATIGAEVIASLLMGQVTYNAFSSGNAYLGVGDSNTAFAVGQTDLQAASNKVRIAMDGGYPSRSSNVLTFRATAGSSVGNFAWLENALFNASAAAQMLVRKVINLGTKVSGATWIFTKTVTITAG